MKDKLIAVAFLGSPRIGGNTDILLDKVIEGMKDKVNIEKIVLNELKISPCQHCDGCLKDGNCVIQDDMQLIYPKIISANVIIIASPIFFIGLSAQTKAMIDRCQAIWARKYILKRKISDTNERYGFFISCGGMNKPDIFDGALLTIKAFFRVIDVKYKGELLFYNVDKKGEIVNHPTALHDALDIGKKIILFATALLLY